MRGLRTWVVWSVVAAVLLVSPVLAFLLIIAAEMLIDLLMEAKATTVSAIAVGAIGWVLFRRISSQPDPAVQSRPEQEPDERLLQFRQSDAAAASTAREWISRAGGQRLVNRAERNMAQVSATWTSPHGHGSNLEAVVDHRGQCLAQPNDRVCSGLHLRMVAPSPVLVAPSSLRAGVKTSVTIPCEPSFPQLWDRAN